MKGVAMLKGVEQSDCPFCNMDKDRIVFQNNFVKSFYDSYPVSPGHMLIIPNRHISSYFELTMTEHLEILNMIIECRKLLISQFENILGFNIGNNSGEVAGQTIYHCHIHLIPRYLGDMDNPSGGVRGVIPSKQQY